MKMRKEAPRSVHRLWGEFRFSVIGGLLAAPPPEGELEQELRSLADISWTHPVTRKTVKFGFSTIEKWYYKAKKKSADPVGSLRTKARVDAGSSRRISSEVAKILADQHNRYGHWTYQLHADNLKAAIDKDQSLGRPPSYPTVRRFMKAKGLFKKNRSVAPLPGQIRAREHLEKRETRSYEAEYVNSLWHLDYHHGSLRVIDGKGVWHKPILLGIFDDHSRLACHLQWYLKETAENLVHGFCQALQKRGLPRELLNDNGSAMTSQEFTSGLAKLGILGRTTLPYSPQMNGKCEFVWSRLEGRLLSMLTGLADLTLKRLNDLTQAWAEMEYNRLTHRETGDTPVGRFTKNKDVARPCPEPLALRLAFCVEERRRQRRSDATILLNGQRYEIPSRYRSLENITVRYARWDLGFVHLVDEKTGDILARVYPIDKTLNADGRRRLIDEPGSTSPSPTVSKLPPLLEKLSQDYAALGFLPAYLTKDESNQGDATDDAQ